MCKATALEMEISFLTTKNVLLVSGENKPASFGKSRGSSYLKKRLIALYRLKEQKREYMLNCKTVLFCCTECQGSAFAVE